MFDRLQRAVEMALGEAEYSDARQVRMQTQAISVRNGVPEIRSSESEGIGVRVRRGDGWGFAAARGSDDAGVHDAVSRALALAGDAVASPHALAPIEEPAVGEHHSPVTIDPFAVSVQDKLALLAGAEAALHTDRSLAICRAAVECRREQKWLVSSDGARCHQVHTETGGGIDAVAVGPEGTQVRSYPMAHPGHFARAGWEHVLGLGLEANAPRVAEEAVALLTAPPCPAGPTTLVLGGEQLAIQIHESVGHAVELDRVLGGEASYAGTSFVRPDAIGSLRYGSEAMGVTADATLPGAIGSFGWDDEGVAAQKVPIVREGVLAGMLSSRESAAAIGLARSGGCMRAEGFDRQPIVRMTNVSLDAGSAGSLDDLLAPVRRGIYIDANRSWSIDSRRLHFQFGGEAAWEIVDGRLGRMLRDPVYAGVTPTFWAGLEAVCSEPEWALYSVTECGKGEPGQMARVSHGCAPARFAAVTVGSQ